MRCLIRIYTVQNLLFSSLALEVKILTGEPQNHRLSRVVSMYMPLDIFLMTNLKHEYSNAHTHCI